jgi:K+-sensing histidine kinase KdpD
MPPNDNKIARRVTKIWRQGLPPHSLAAYGFAVGCIAAASLCRLAVELIVSSVALFVLYIPAVLVASLVGGVSAGIVALLLGGLAAWLGLLSPSFVLAAPTLTQSVGLATYAISACLVACVAEAYRRAVRQAYEQQRMRLLLIREIQHRNKNLLATVQAIVMQTLRENRPDAERINGRINALAATDDILTRRPQGNPLARVEAVWRDADRAAGRDGAPRAGTCQGPRARRARAGHKRGEVWRAFNAGRRALHRLAGMGRASSDHLGRTWRTTHLASPEARVRNIADPAPAGQPSRDDRDRIPAGRARLQDFLRFV